MTEAKWVDLGPAAALKDRPVRALTVERTRLALTFKDGKFGAISGICNHVGGPLGEGTLDGDYVVCPWHGWKFHCTHRPGRARLRGRPGAVATRSRSATATCS